MFNGIKNYVFNREIDINERLTLIFVNLGIVVGSVGVLICILAKVPLIGVLITSAIPVFAVLINILTHMNKNVNLFAAMMDIGVSVLVPLVYLTCGASRSGVLVWYAYAIFFVTMSHRGKGVWKYLAFCILMQMLSFVVEWRYNEYIFYLTDTRHLFISIIGSLLAVSTALAITLLLIIEIYKKEQQLADSRAEELEQLNDSLNKSNEAQKAFLANMSHEIRTPINGILGMNELIAREAKDTAISEYSSNISESGQLLLSLVNDILDFSKIEAGKLDIIDAEYKLTDMLDDVSRMIGQRAEDKGLKFIVDIDPELPAVLYGDVNRVKQILINLLSNAVKYTDRGVVKLKLLHAKEDDDNIRLEFAVKDTGRGIKTDDLNSLFKSFSRVDMGANRNIEGTGLGLAITASLVSQMDGAIEVKSTYGVGSLFTGYILQRKVSEETVGTYEEDGQKTVAESSKYHASYKAPDAKVLIVDDNRLNLLVEKKLLSITGVQIVTVESGKEAIRQIKEQKFDFVFLDHMMPEMDGIETLNIIRNEHLADDMPIVVLTANAIAGYKEMYLEAGFTDYLSKPVEGAALEGMLFKYLPKDKVQIVVE